MFDKFRARSLVYRLVREGVSGEVVQQLLKKPNPHAAPYLIEVLRAESDSSVEGHKFLSRVSGREVRFCDVETTRISNIAAKALAPLADKRAAEVFRLLLTAADRELRLTARVGLAALGDTKWQHLVRGDEADYERLASSGSLDAWSVLCTGLRHQSNAAFHACEEAVKTVGAGILPILLEDLKEAPARSRAAIARALGAIDDQRARDSLLKLLNDRSDFVAGSAARALGILKEPRAYEPLARMLSLDPGRGRAVLCDVAFALGRLGDPRATQSLIAITNCDIQRYALAAVAALGDLGDARALDPLVTLLKTPTQRLAEKFSLNPTALGIADACQSMAPNPAAMAVASWIGKVREADALRAEVARSLGKLKDSRAVGPLSEVLGDPDPDVKGAAVAALEALGSPAAAGPRGWATCDVCREQVPSHQGFVLSTRDVVTSPSYWTVAFKGAKEVVGLSQTGEIERLYRGHILQQCAQKTGWLVCDSCIRLFPTADRQRAEISARDYWGQGGQGSYAPPGGGAVAPQEACAAAATAWREVTGTAAPWDDSG